MFEEQFASREHDSTVPCPTRVVADAGLWQARNMLAQGMTRAKKYVRGRRTASRVRGQRHTVARDSRGVFASVSQSRSCRSKS
jgi:hypothetical protein